VTRAWTVTSGAAREVPPAEAVRAVLGGQCHVWIDLEDETAESATELLRPLAIHPLVIEDLVMDVNRPKVDDYGDYLYVAMHSARWDGDRPHLREIDIVLGERFLISYHDGATRSIAAAHDVLPRRPELLAGSPARLLHFLLDVLVDHYLPIVDRVAEQVDALEEELFSSDGSGAHARIVSLKRGMSALRRVVGPQRDTVLALTRDEFRTVPADVRPYLRDVYDRLARVSDLLDSFRDETASLLDLHVSLVSNRMNDVIKRLTVIATVGLPLTVVTSYYGMNFPLAEYHWRFGALYVLALLIATGAGVWWYLKRKRWM
jgi:magnesium transporter